MAKPKYRELGEIYRPVAKVLKEIKGLPTRIEINGQEYFMINPVQDKKDHFNNSKARRAKKRKALQQKRSEKHESNKII